MQKPFILGTPLPSEETDKERFIPEWKQEARDESGSKRFHGAFTGGFSAGYHNTVGSREGWRPSTFTSSRSQRGTLPSQHRTEEYMDEEDLREMKNDLHLVTTEQFKGETGTVMVRRGIGWQILRRTGWRGEEEAVTPLDKLLCSSKRLPLKEPKGEKESLGLGVGVLLEDEDDQDIYVHEENKSGLKYNKFIEPLTRTFEPTRHPSPSSRAIGSSGGLEGFVRAARESLGLEVKFDPPLVPEGYVPNGPFKDYKEPKGDGSRIKVPTEPLSIAERSLILDEGRASIAPGPMQYFPLTQKVKLDVMTAMAAQRGYMPFVSNPAKDARYRQFLAHFASLPSSSPSPLPARPASMSEAEHKREQDEFVKAANIYRPLPATMASKFVSSSKSNLMGELDRSNQPAGLYKPEPKLPVSPSLNTVERREVSEGTTVKPLGALTYGKDTRRELTWTPPSSLCKPFGVDPPQQVTSEAKFGVRPVLSAHSLHKIVAGSAYASKVDLDQIRKQEAGQEDEIQNDDIQLGEDLTRPAMELFRSIFGDRGSAIDESLEGGFGNREPISSKRAPAPATWKRQALRLPILKLEETGAGGKGAVADDLETPLVSIKKQRPAAADLWDRE